VVKEKKQILDIARNGDAFCLMYHASQDQVVWQVEFCFFGHEKVHGMMHYFCF
jgi:hypothetical protein